MRVQSSHLALRFYKHDGWTEEVLRECLSYGDIEFCPGNMLDYWRLKVGSGFDVDKLMEHTTQVDRWYDKESFDFENKKTDAEYIREMNW